MFRASRGRLLRLGFGVALFGVLVWLYAGAATAGFTNWDDDRFISSNPLFLEGGWPYIRAAFTKVQFEAYHPFHVLSYLPDRYLWPTWPPGFHLVNLALFAADVLVLWRLVRRYTSELAACAAVALFALHPLCVEPAAWVTDRKEPLVVLFFLLALGREARHTGLRPERWAMVLFVCALLSKTSSVCFPIVLFAWVLWIQGRPVREALVRSASYAAVAIAVSVAVVVIWRGHGMIVHRAASLPVEVATTIAAYAGHVLWPVDLGAAYPLDVSHPLGAVMFCVLAAIAIAAGWRWLPPRARFAVFAVGGALLPVSNLVPMTLRLSDRYLFLALVMLVLPVASAIDWAVERSQARPGRAIACVAAIALVVAVLEARLTARLVPTWQSSEALWAHAVEAQPGAFLAHLKYGEVLQDERRWSDALTQLWAAQQLNPGNPLPSQRLLHLDAARAEQRGALAAGTAERWWHDSNRALGDRAAYERLAGEVAATPCAPCGDAVVLLGVTAWPMPDAELLAAARRALDQHAVVRARIYLDRVRDRMNPEFDALVRRAAGPSAARP